MLHHIKRPGTLFCFSPPIMIITFALEIGMAIYVLWRYKLTHISRLIVMILVSLAIFQLAEYNVCGGYGITAQNWSRIGFAAITTLPPLGLHLLYMLSNRPRRRLVVASYAAMVLFMVFFLLAPSAFNSYQCTGNYVIFHLNTTASMVYGAYYYGLLVTAILLGLRWLRATGSGAMKQARRSAVWGLLVGYLVFLVPTTVANTVAPATLSGIPSIMCGFAVLFAIILTVYIAPRTVGRRQ
jgi:hypothetical protein